jgi:hypothetical protein
MQRDRMTVARLRNCRTPALLMLVLHVGACTTWTPVTLTPPGEFVSEEEPKVVRATGSDGTRVVLENPRVRNDSIVEVKERCDMPFGGAEPVCQLSEGTALDLSDVSGLEVGRTDVGKFVGGLLLVSLGVVVVGAGIFYLTFEPS